MTLLIVALIVLFFGYHSPKFRLDASADSLLLENDQSLEYYRSVKDRYGSDNIMILTYTPKSDLFALPALEDIVKLHDELAKVGNVQSVASIISIPLFDTNEGSLREIIKNPEYEGQIDIAKTELLSSPLYKDLFISKNSQTAAFLLTLPDKQTIDEESETTAAVRAHMENHREKAKLHLGGVAMIVADSISFIERDLVIFGIGVFVFLVFLLALTFRSARWVIIPMLTCLCVGITMIGILGYYDWPVTVVSSNFISLLLIITLSLTVHLIVRYRELLSNNPDIPKGELMFKAAKYKFMPCFYTAATTIVAFMSLVVSDIRPIIDFGWMMTIGITIALVYAFTLFPALVMMLEREAPTDEHRDVTAKITNSFSWLIENFGKTTLTGFSILIIVSAVGVSLLTVENRFIDYYKESTEIYKGMELIDNELGGTTPLDIIIDAPKAKEIEVEHDEESEFYSDEYLSVIPEEKSITDGYWFNSFILEDVAIIHKYLEDLPESGKVISLDTLIKMAAKIADQKEFEGIGLGVLNKKLPEELRELLLKPYISEDGNQVRFSLRVFESDPNLKRTELMNKIRNHLTTKLGINDEDLHFTGMLVMYNNLLQSLFKSQILTIGVVFFAIFLMFIIFFRQMYVSLIAVLPSMVAALSVLGIMGWLHIPLDIMTITIAAICIGIAVDNAIHYVHRMTAEFNESRDYWKAVKASHASIGRAMYYTTIIIAIGFSILAFSNFVPTIYFGLLTGFAMLVGLLANFTLLPLLIVVLKPLGKERA